MPRSKFAESVEKRKIISLVKAVPRRIEAKDKEWILDLYDTNDPKFSSFEDTPDLLSRLDGSKFREFIDRLSKLESASIIRRNLRVDLLVGKVAIVTGMDDWKTQEDGRETKGVSRFTIVLWKKKGAWKVIHEHFTKIA